MDFARRDGARDPFDRELRAARRWAGAGALLLTALLAVSFFGCEARPSEAETALRSLREGQANLRTPAGKAALRKAAQLFEGAGKRADQREALYWLALAHQKSGEHADALATLQHAMAVVPQGDDPEPELGFYSGFEAQLMMGESQLELQDYAAARGAFERARQIAVASGSRWNEWRSVEALAGLHTRQRDPERARALFAEARPIAAQESRWALGQTAKRWGDFERDEGDLVAARRLYDEAIAAHREALAKLAANPGTPNHTMHVERSQLGAAQALLAAARLEQSRSSYAAAEEASREGLALMASMPTEPEPGPDGITWSEGPRQNREVIGQLERVQAQARRELEREGAPRQQPSAPE